MKTGGLFQKKFISIGDTNIKLSNIKAFGISNTPSQEIATPECEYYIYKEYVFYRGPLASPTIKTNYTVTISKERYDIIKMGLAKQKNIYPYVIYPFLLSQDFQGFMLDEPDNSEEVKKYFVEHHQEFDKMIASGQYEQLVTKDEEVEEDEWESFKHRHERNHNSTTTIRSYPKHPSYVYSVKIKSLDDISPADRNKVYTIKKENVKHIPSKKYLYVTTYQNDNYQFFEDNGQFNIYTKLNELKTLLG